MHPNNAQLPALLGLSQKQLRLAELIGLGMSPGDAAKTVGMSIEAATAAQMLPAVQAYSTHLARSSVRTEILPLSTRTVRDILSDPNAPASARVAAVRLVWTASGLLSPQAGDPADAPPTAAGFAPISPAADAELAALRDRLDSLREILSRAPIEATAIDPLE